MIHSSRLIRTVPTFNPLKQHTMTATMHAKFPTVEFLLSEASKNDCIKKLKSVKLPHQELNETNKKRAAVLIPLCTVEGEISLLYTLRKADLKRHRGQVSFPGGIEDDTDSSLEYTALRETEEELGISRKDIQLWGSGCIYVGKEFSVLPVVGYLGEVDIAKLNPNPDEVDTAFALSLKHFCDPKNCRTTQFRYRGQSYILPVYINGEYRVWGITALITHILLASLLKSHYDLKLKLVKTVGISSQ